MAKTINHQANRLKCRWCAWTCARFIGKKVQQRKLFLHAMDEHEEEVKTALGIESEASLLDYCDAVDATENRMFGYL